jgi:hypothetical protein
MGMVVQRHATQADAGWPNALAAVNPAAEEAAF